ncbi:MAG TPA: sulfite exporter TauE/SafE family protein [Candidatus Desulfovibrio gallistercoris]|nr:sulfite exporter TauE/SafE family protein [Candidatus Desulfovibrio gallistercoris]
MLAITAVCFLVGFLGAVTGVGGVIVPPILMFAGGLETHVAMGTALLSFFPLSLVGAVIYARRDWYRPREAVVFLLGGIAGGIAGGMLNAHIPGPPLVCLLACVIIFAGLAALRPHRQGKGSAFWLSGRGLFCIGLATGLTAGLTGAGGPVLSIPWMVAVGYTPFYAVGSSMFMQLGTILSGSWGNACSGFIDWKILPWVMLAELAGCLVGLQVAKRISSELARKAIGVLCTGLGMFLLLRQILEF